MQFKLETLVDRPDAEVMEVLADLRNHPSFMTEGFSGFQFPSGSRGKGAEMRFWWQVMGRRHEAAFEVAQQDDHNVVLRSIPGSEVAGDLWYWVQGNEMGSYVKLVVDCRRPKPGFLGRGRREIMEPWRKALDALKRRVEGEPGADSSEDVRDGTGNEQWK